MDETPHAGATLERMRTLTPDPPPAEVQALLQRRRRLGLDRLDEVWEGVLHMVPGPSHAHAAVSAQVKALLRQPAAAAGLAVTDEFNLGDSEADFRVPDGGLHRPGAAEMWHPTAALVLEVISSGDESVEKLPFYAAHAVDEVLIVDPAQRSVHWLRLSDGGGPAEQGGSQEARSARYQPMERSRLIDMGAAELGQRIDWP